MTNDLFYKGNGVLMRGQHALKNGGMYRALSPFEMSKHFNFDENPFHINSKTMRRFDEEDPRYELRDLMKTIVEESVYALKKANHPAATNETELRRMLRHMLNQSASIHDARQRDDRNKYGQDIYLDVNDERSLSPQMQGHAFAPSVQKNIKNLKPEQIRLRNNKGQMIMYQSSQADHAQHGHMSESGFYAALPIFVNLFKKEFGIDPHHTLADGNYIKPEGMAIYRNEDGSTSKVWQYHYARQNPQFHTGRGGDKLHGSHHIRSAMGSLHPVWFQPTSQSLDPKTLAARRAYAYEILTRGGTRPATEDQIENFTRSPLMQVLHESARGQRADRSRKTITGRLLNDMKQALGMHRSDSGTPPTNEQEDLRRRLEYNAGNIDISHYVSNKRERKHNSARPILQNALYMSMLLEDENLNREFQRLRGVQDGFNVGASLRSKFQQSHAADTSYVNSSNFRFEDPRNVPTAATDQSPAPRIDLGSFMLEAPNESSRGQAPGYRFANPFRFRRPLPDLPEDNDVMTSRDSVSDLLEHLQSADARMDSTVLKTLPSKRRFDLSDSYDCDILCKTYSLEKRDLHLINQSMGDWTTIAERLKIKPDVVKAVKVALRW